MMLLDRIDIYKPGAYDEYERLCDQIDGIEMIRRIYEKKKDKE